MTEADSAVLLNGLAYMKQPNQFKDPQISQMCWHIHEALIEVLQSGVLSDGTPVYFARGDPTVADAPDDTVGHFGMTISDTVGGRPGFKTQIDGRVFGSADGNSVDPKNFSIIAAEAAMHEIGHALGYTDHNSVQRPGTYTTQPWASISQTPGFESCF